MLGPLQTACVLPVIILEELTGVEPVDSPDIEPILAWSFTMGSDRQRMTEKPMNDKQNKLRPQRCSRYFRHKRSYASQP